MKSASWVVGLILGTVIGAVVGAYAIAQTVTQVRNPIQEAVHNRNLLERMQAEQNLLHAGGNDRFEDYVMCTGAVAVNPRAPTDGLWVLDYRAGKLLGTVIDRTQGKIQGFAEVNLVNDFQIPPKQNVH